jgi:hypothetical protein
MHDVFMYRMMLGWSRDCTSSISLRHLSRVFSSTVSTLPCERRCMCTEV